MIALLLLFAQAALPAPAPQPAQVAPEDNYVNLCLSCHGSDGRGQTRKGRELRAPDFTSAKWQKHTTDREIRAAIVNGIPKREMPAFEDKLSKSEIDALIPYIRSFRN